MNITINEVINLSIRYTLRHNIPSMLVSNENSKYAAKNSDIQDMFGSEPTEEDVNNFTQLRNSDYDFNLLRKHELAETDDNRVVYRQKDGQIVDWTDEATQQAQFIKEECLTIKQDIVEYASEVESTINGIIEDAQDQQRAVEDLVEEVEDMVDLEKITILEIDEIVQGASE